MRRMELLETLCIANVAETCSRMVNELPPDELLNLLAGESNRESSSRPPSSDQRNAGIGVAELVRELVHRLPGELVQQVVQFLTPAALLVFESVTQVMYEIARAPV